MGLHPLLCTIKKLAVPALLMQLLVLPAQAQTEERTYRRFKIDLMVFGLTRPVFNDIHNRHAYAFEPRYVMLNRKLELGGRYEWAYIGPYHEFEYLKSIALTADWFLNNNRLRPFFGVGLGSFVTSGVHQGTALHWYTPAGIIWRTGLEYWHLRASVEANVLDKSSGYTLDYLTFKFGGHVAFGKKKKY